MQLKKLASRANLKKLLIACGLGLFLIFILGENLKNVLIIAVLTIIASFSTFYQNFLKSPVNFELIKFSTVLCAASYGLMEGLLVGISSTIASKMLSEKLDQSAFVSIIGIVAIAIFSAMSSSQEIVFLGVAMVILYHLITAPIQMAMGGTLAYGVIYVGTNLLFNLAFFSRLGPMIFGLMV